MDSLIARSFALLALICTLVAGVFLWVRLDSPIRNVLVEGQLDTIEKQQISSIVTDNLDGGLLSADLDVLGERIRALSWPRTVEIRRAWPDTLNIKVDKVMVVAAWRENYLTSDGHVVSLATRRTGLPEFDCALSEPTTAMEVFHRLNAETSPELPIVKLTENDLGEWRISFPGGQTLMLGTENLRERFARFLLVYERSLKTKLDQVAGVDARYTNGVAVSWRAEDIRNRETVATNNLIALPVSAGVSGR